MNIFKPSAVIEDEIDGQAIIKKLERAGKTCYKSEANIGMGTGEKFIKAIIKKRHETILEHVTVSVRVICDRGISHEFVRHRIMSFSQESTRYCNYNKEKFGNELTIIKPCFWGGESNECNEVDSKKFDVWIKTMEYIQNAYNELIELGATPQEARSVLPNSLKTEFVATANLREWRHFFNLRAIGTTGKPHPQMTEIAIPLLKEFQSKIPIIFDDIKEEKGM